jgi:carbon storage regulator
MLVLSRKTNESIVIDGNITVSVLRVDHDNVRIGIDAPLEIPVLRKEIYEAIKTNNEMAAGSAKRKVKQVKVKQLVKN